MPGPAAPFPALALEGRHRPVDHLLDKNDSKEYPRTAHDVLVLGGAVVSEEMEEQVAEVLASKRARLVEKVNANRRQREQFDEEIRTAEALIEAYDVVLRAQHRPVISTEQARLGAGLTEVFAETSGDVEMEMPEQPTVPNAILNLLIQRSRAMHADEIVAELQERGMRLSAKDPKASVVTALVRGAKKGIFEKVGPNKYRENLRRGDA